ncbi:MAG: hypothetical protein NTX25_02530, partial [Proteobacteria bacterium]|nr:hypothetical protein [Pseudomonadota bacterium]
AAKVRSERDKAEVANISALSQATALMSYSGSSPASNKPSSFPYIYPDPYIDNSFVAGVRTLPQVPTWSFRNQSLQFQSPGSSSLQSDDFAKYVDSGVRPALTSKMSLTFTSPVYDATRPFLIKGFLAEVKSSSYGGQELTTRAEVPVPRPEPPSCTLSSANGKNRFAPNQTITLVLRTSGVSQSAMIPKDGMNLGQALYDLTGYEEVDLTDKANSIRKINQLSHSWQLTTPRPLIAVDGLADVAFTTYAYLSRVDMNSNTAAYCSFTFYVSPPATCKLWTDKASVSPGQCVQISSGFAGPAKPNSLSLSVTDPSGDSIPGLTQTSSTTGQFCTPAIAMYNKGGVTVPAKTSALITNRLSSLTVDQKKTLYDQLQILASNLLELFGDKSILTNLSIAQYNDLFSLSDQTLDELAKIKLNGYPNLKNLTAAQKSEFVKLGRSSFDPLGSMKEIHLRMVGLLRLVRPLSLLSTLEKEDSQFLTATLAEVLNQDVQKNTAAVDYNILGEIEALDGGTANCLVHVTSGNNLCPLFGSQYPNATQTAYFYYGANGRAYGGMDITFSPGPPNWEVGGTASTPMQVEPCPAGARCYAIDWGGWPRTPFAVIKDASSSSCSLSFNPRMDLGCFESSTKIRMADGSEREIQSLKRGDQVYNPLRKKAFAIGRMTQGPEKKPLIEIKTASARIRVTSKHPFITKRGLVTADQLLGTDQIALEPDTWMRVESIQSTASAPKDWVWNFTIADDSSEIADHAVLANGIVTGDLYLQEQLSRDQSVQALGRQLVQP